jgi:hypothetical protein
MPKMGATGVNLVGEIHLDIMELIGTPIMENGEQLSK